MADRTENPGSSAASDLMAFGQPAGASECLHRSKGVPQFMHSRAQERSRRRRCYPHALGRVQDGQSVEEYEFKSRRRELVQAAKRCLHAITTLHGLCRHQRENAIVLVTGECPDPREPRAAHEPRLPRSLVRCLPAQTRQPRSHRKTGGPPARRLLPNGPKNGAHQVRGVVDVTGQPQRVAVNHRRMPVVEQPMGGFLTVLDAVEERGVAFKLTRREVGH